MVPRTSKNNILLHYRLIFEIWHILADFHRKWNYTFFTLIWYAVIVFLFDLPENFCVSWSFFIGFTILWFYSKLITGEVLSLEPENEILEKSFEYTYTPCGKKTFNEHYISDISKERWAVLIKGNIYLNPIRIDPFSDEISYLKFRLISPFENGRVICIWIILTQFLPWFHTSDSM